MGGDGHQGGEDSRGCGGPRLAECGMNGAGSLTTGRPCGPTFAQIGREGAMAPASLSTGLQSFSPIPTIKPGPTGAGSRVGGLVHTPSPCGSLQRPLLRGWESLPLPPQPPWAFSTRDLRLYFPRPGALGCTVCFAPHRLSGLSVYECGAAGCYPLLCLPCSPLL